MALCYPCARERPVSVPGGNRRVSTPAQACSKGLVVRDLREEVVVYDTRSHRAHCLNSTAAFVFRHADGRRTDAEIASLLGPGADEELVAEAVEQLAGAGLLEPSPGGAEPASSRREVLRQVALGAAVLAPVVVSLLVPSPAEAAATCIPAASCTTAKIGQPCYTSNPAVECANYTCQGAGICSP
jgi:hypothetical protein